jgi:hypothetical protein
MSNNGYKYRAKEINKCPNRLFDRGFRQNRQSQDEAIKEINRNKIYQGEPIRRAQLRHFDVSFADQKMLRTSDWGIC